MYLHYIETVRRTQSLFIYFLDGYLVFYSRNYNTDLYNIGYTMVSDPYTKAGPDVFHGTPIRGMYTATLGWYNYLAVLS